MTINLADLPAATNTYIDDEVDVTITKVTRNLQPNEDGTFTISITNGAVRLRDVVLHVTSNDPTAVLLMPPGSAMLFPRATANESDPRLPSNVPVAGMFVFYLSDDPEITPNSILEPGELRELELEYHAEAVGDATIFCHVHASVDVDDLFPRSSGSNGSKVVTIVS